MPSMNTQMPSMNTRAYPMVQMLAQMMQSISDDMKMHILASHNNNTLPIQPSINIPTTHSPKPFKSIPTSSKVDKKRKTKHHDSDDEDDEDNEDSSASSDSDMSSLSDYSMGEQTFKSLQKAKYGKTKKINACVAEAIERHN